MTRIDNSKIFYEGVYADVTVYVPAKTTYKEGTVLGRNASGKLTAFTTDVENSEPLYILGKDLINDTDSAVEMSLVRVFDGGVCDANKLIFVKAADKTTAAVLDALKKNGFKLENVENGISTTTLA